MARSIITKFIKKPLPLLALLLLIPWPIAYANDNGAAAQGTVRIRGAEPSAAPSATTFAGNIGGITPGDLFYIDASDHSADIVVTLYLTNTQELIYCYRYMTLRVGAYVWSSTNQWQKAARSDGELVPDNFITLRNGQVSFTLPGYADYKVTIDSGCYYCFATNVDGGSVSPQFYLTVDSPKDTKQCW